MKKLSCLIPARLASTRFPRKILADLEGKPLIQHVYESAQQYPFEEIVIAVDAQETFDVVSSFGAKAIMTSTSCQSGVDRLIEVLKRNKIRGECFVNWQGDEPFVNAEMIEQLMLGEGDVWTLKKELGGEEDPKSPHVVKVVTDHSGHALYFSRSLIPYGGDKIYKHIGIYGYSKEALLRIAQMERTPLEKAENLEQLRFLENGLKIRVNETIHSTIGIDTSDDLERARDHLRSLSCAS